MDTETAPSRSGGFLVQIVTHGLAILLGAGLGAGGLRLAEYYENPEAMSRPEGELSRAQLIAKLDEAEKKYAEMLAQSQQQQAAAQDEIAAAGQKVTDLETQVTAKQDEIKVLELKVKKSQGKSAALQKELEAKLAELESLKGELQVALEEKARLEADLVVSREETRVAREETEVARDQTVDARWDGFVSETIVQICEKGNRNKLAKCKEEVRASMSGARAQRFKHCVASGQATPRLVRVDSKDKDPQLPKWSEWVDQESKFTSDAWYLTFCDPTLPESSGLRAGQEEPGDERDPSRFEGLDEDL
jgi:predicted  nucleic acid-binding Zn-ribbon protein